MTTYIEQRTALRVQPPPWQYLEYASIASLQSFELNRLNHAANLMKQIQSLLRQYFDDTAAASVARIFMHQPSPPHSAASPHRQSFNGFRPASPIAIVRATLA